MARKAISEVELRWSGVFAEFVKKKRAIDNDFPPPILWAKVNKDQSRALANEKQSTVEKRNCQPRNSRIQEEVETKTIFTKQSRN